MDSHTRGLSHVASFLEQNDGVPIAEQSPAEAALACKPHITSVWFNEQWWLNGEPISLFRERQDSTGVFLQDRVGFLPKCQEGSHYKCWHDCEGKKWGVYVSIPLTSTGDLIVGPGLLLHSEPKTVTAIDFHHEGYLWNQKGQKSIVCFAENVGRQGKECRDLNEDKNLSSTQNWNIFVFSLCSANWRDLSQTISFLTWRLKDSPQILLECLQPVCFQTSRNNVLLFGWNLVHAFQRGNLLKNYLFYVF